MFVNVIGWPRYAVVCLLFTSFYFFGDDTTSTTIADDVVERKTKKSDFDVRDLNKLMLAAVDNSANQVKDAVPPGDYTVCGRVLDQQGKPVKDVQVMLGGSEHGPSLYRANFDVTDEFGRFIVTAAPHRKIIYIKVGDVFWSMHTQGQDEVTLRLPMRYQVSFFQGTLTELLNDKLWVKSRTQQVGTASVFGDQSTTIKDAQAGNFRLPPGKYLVYGSRRLATSADPIAGYAELAEIEVLARDKQSFQLGRREGTTISGVVREYDKLLGEGFIAIQLSLSIPETTLQREYRVLDTITCRPDGSFEFEPVPEARYSIRATKIADPNVKRLSLGRFGSVPANPRLFQERVTVGGETMQLSLPTKREVKTTADKVHQILDSEHPQPNVSWSWSDVQITQLRGLEDREGVIDELLRLLRADDTPDNWRWLVIESLWRIRPISKETKQALVTAMNDPVNASRRGSLLRTLRQMRDEAAETLDLIIRFKDDEDWRVRYGVADALGEIGQSLINPPEQVVDTLILLLDDQHGMIRKEAAGSLGELKSTRAVEALKKRMTDPYGPARAMAAWALWECTLDAEPSLTTFIELLQQEDCEARFEAGFYVDALGRHAESALPALRANLNYEKKPPFRNANETIRYRTRSVCEDSIEEIEAAIALHKDERAFQPRVIEGDEAAALARNLAPHWGPPTDGLELGIALAAGNTQFKIGARVPLRLFVRNTTEQPMRFEIDYRLPGIAPQVQPAKGRRLYVRNLQLRVRDRNQIVDLAPGTTIVITNAGIGLGPNPQPGERFWHPFIEQPIAGEVKISQQLYTRLHSIEKGTKKTFWLKSGETRAEFVDGAKGTEK